MGTARAAAAPPDWFVLCPQWFSSEADSEEGAGRLTASKFRADWAYRQREFEVFPGLSHGVEPELPRWK